MSKCPGTLDTPPLLLPPRPKQSQFPILIHSMKPRDLSPNSADWVSLTSSRRLLQHPSLPFFGVLNLLLPGRGFYLMQCLLFPATPFQPELSRGVNSCPGSYIWQCQCCSPRQCLSLHFQAPSPTQGAQAQMAPLSDGGPFKSLHKDCWLTSHILSSSCTRSWAKSSFLACSGVRTIRDLSGGR